MTHEEGREERIAGSDPAAVLTLAGGIAPLFLIDLLFLEHKGPNDTKLISHKSYMIGAL